MNQRFIMINALVEAQYVPRKPANKKPYTAERYSLLSDEIVHRHYCEMLWEQMD